MEKAALTKAGLPSKLLSCGMQSYYTYFTVKIKKLLAIGKELFENNILKFYASNNFTKSSKR